MKILNTVLDFLLNNEIPPELTIDTLLSQLGISMEDYNKALATGIKGRSYIVKRNLTELFINNYNPTNLGAWQANIDIQPVLDTYACLVYICSYVTKDERTMSELLRNARRVC